MTSAYYLGADIGGTKTEIVVVDQNFTVQSSLRTLTVTNDSQGFLNGLLAGINETLERGEIGPDALAAIGIGIPGQVDRAAGEVQLAVNLGLNAFPLAAELESVFDVPVVVENDVRVAALGTHNYFAEKESISDLAYIGIGTGISAGLVLQGELHRGVNGMAGEIGHVMMDPEGIICPCGQRGCLETIAAGPAIIRQGIEAGLPGINHNSSADEVYQLAGKGHSEAQQIVRHVAQTLSRAIQWVTMTYDVEKVVLGGGVTSAGPAFLATILSELAELRAQSQLALKMLPDEKFILLPGDFNAGVWGAVRMAQQVTKVSI